MPERKEKREDRSHDRERRTKDTGDIPGNQTPATPKKKESERNR